MARQYLDSSAINWVDYDGATATLVVEFTSGMVYRYFAVPRSVVERLLAAPSVGTYFQEQIRDVYPFDRA